MNDRTRENLSRSFAAAPELTPDRIAHRAANARELRILDLEELGRCHATARAIGIRNDLELNVIADVGARRARASAEKQGRMSELSELAYKRLLANMASSIAAGIESRAEADREPKVSGMPSKVVAARAIDIAEEILAMVGL